MSIFADPLQNWRNDDLLLDENSRKALADDDAHLLRALDWPELRAAFEPFERDAQAGQGGTLWQRSIVVGFATTGLMVTALVPLLSAGDQSIAGIVASIITVIAGLIAVGYAVRGAWRRTWLRNRFRAERLRQLNFQFLIYHLDLVRAALRDSSAMERLKTARAQALDATLSALSDDNATKVKIDAMLKDEAGELGWLLPVAEVTPSSLRNDPDTLRLLDAIKRLRIDVQLAYTERKLSRSVQTTDFQALIIDRISQGVSLTMLSLALFVGLSLWMKWTSFSTVLIVIEGLLGAALAGLRLTIDAFGADEDARRYRRYLDECRHRKTEYDAAGDEAEGRYRALRKLEENSYRELRDFVQLQRRRRLI